MGQRDNYVSYWEGNKAVRVKSRFQLRSGSVGLFEDKKRCSVLKEDLCYCNGGEVESEIIFFHWRKGIIHGSVLPLHKQQGGRH